MMARSICQHGQCDGVYSWGVISHQDMTVYGVPTLLLALVVLNNNALLAQCATVKMHQMSSTFADLCFVYI